LRTVTLFPEQIIDLGAPQPKSSIINQADIALENQRFLQGTPSLAHFLMVIKGKLRARGEQADK